MAQVEIFRSPDCSQDGLALFVFVQSSEFDSPTGGLVLRLIRYVSGYP